MLLVTADGRLVSREEIEERLWGKGVFVDTEHGINTAIRKIRQVLRDHPEHPRFVQTVQRKGYRFIADVTNIREIQSQNDGAAKGEEFIPSRGSEPSRMNQSEPGTAGADDGAVPVRRASRRLVWSGIAAAILLGWPAYKFVLPRIELDTTLSTSQQGSHQSQCTSVHTPGGLPTRRSFGTAGWYARL